jgi:hypothetical protein
MPLARAVRALGRCVLRTVGLVVQGRIGQPTRLVGRHVCFADGTSSRVYRETIVQSPTVSEPSVLVVGFRLRRVRSGRLHSLFRWESQLNTVLFAGFEGFVSKLWLRHDQNGLYRGVYQWDGPDLAVAYVRALWWPLAAVSEKGSIRYALLPGRDRDDVLADPGGLGRMTDQAGGWWRPTRVQAGAADAPGGGNVPPAARVRSSVTAEEPGGR